MKSRTNLQIRHLSLCIDQVCILWPLGKAVLAKLRVWLGVGGVWGGDVINDVADASSGKDGKRDETNIKCEQVEQLSKQ